MAKETILLCTTILPMYGVDFIDFLKSYLFESTGREHCPYFIEIGQEFYSISVQVKAPHQTKQISTVELPPGAAK